ncbi:protein phosphatase 2c, putative [Ichthyophthirius multifiliis]|uniref:protein-serine/threonine phosphatase n=1 Tax=Ichthyophthirius multifiliis TaxID=5932 RepID=G0QTU0_ICHMU|nr:protein phosphatase 2c, putative [Ichthyophthirius multifiliis]EGR31365.1 protein phosphatase 2c, putative [Ichthyophthirius multifiliis]|eukprot:XP_004034851.1 protein phosphatase 2c, putative [Ichthyophthirius multifiliis]
MGPYLSNPITEKITIEDEQNQYLKYSYAEMQGWRNTMEDSHISNINIGEDIALFGIFDGHGGHEVARFVELHFIEELKKNDNFFKKNFEQALKETFLKMDELMLKKEGLSELLKIKSNNNNNNAYDENDIKQTYAGCTANVALIYKKQQIYVANSGDSRTVLCTKDKKPIELSIDHKPDNIEEKNRIQKAGGFISDGRVNGNLNLSRALGDFEYKKGAKSPEDFIISAFPEVKIKELNQDDKFVLMGCDGIWECMTNQELMDFCYERIQKGMKLKNILIELLDTIIAKDTSDGVGCDNMTTILIQLK